MNRFFIVCLVVITQSALSISLEKIMHHKNNEIKNMLEAPLELGKLVFYFSQMPEIKKTVRQTSATSAQVDYFFKDVTATSGVKDLVAQAQKSARNTYSFTIQTITKPENGLLLTISYDPTKLFIDTDQFVAIGLQKGFVIYFFNKVLLDTLQNNDEKILSTVFKTDKKKMPIIIDCGHGGSDSGAISSTGLTEKEVVLCIGKQVAEHLESNGYRVLLTRCDDQTMPLNERTTFANAKNALLLVSIHANYAPNKTASGLETFFFDHDIMQSAKNNKNKIINAHKNAIARQSKQLSDCMHEKVLAAVKQANPDLVDRKVKKAVSQILLGAAMPASLIEVGFLSNAHEAYLLADKEYLSLISKGISQGITSYLAKLP